MGRTIGVVMIVKNEEAMLGRCLESVKEADEIVICDTGSTDRTVDIARQYTDKVFTDFTWCDDFAKARNHAKSKATADWILSIDADEYLHDFSSVREAAERSFLAVDCLLIATDNQQKHLFPRLFKNSPQVNWVGAVHNHISVLGEQVGNPPQITYDYSPAHFSDKNRTLRILEREVKTPGKIRELFYLGREYFYRNRFEDTVVTLGRYVQQSRYMAEKGEAFLTMARAYYAMGLMDDARDACVQALIGNADFKEACLFMAQLAGDGRGNAKWQRNADQWKRMAAGATNQDVLFIREAAVADVEESKPAPINPVIDPARISACLITKDPVYPKVILDQIHKYGFGEILILTNCDSPHRKQSLFEKAQHDFIYYCDDDCLPPIAELLENADLHKIVCAMKAGHIRHYAKSRIALVGWGAIFPKSVIRVLDQYRAAWGEDALYKRESERIMTYLNYPQVRLELPITDLPSATAPDRLSMQPGHYENIRIVEDRCAQLLERGVYA